MCNSPGIMKLVHIKIYPLVWDQAEWSQWPVKMATGHFPNCSHNFAWRGVINHHRMITLTLQTKYDTTLPSGYPKFAYPLEKSFWIRNLFTHDQTFPAVSPSVVKRSAVTLFTVTSSPGHVNHVFTIMTLPHSPNSEIFIAPEQYIFHSDGERR